MLHKKSVPMRFDLVAERDIEQVHYTIYYVFKRDFLSPLSVLLDLISLLGLLAKVGNVVYFTNFLYKNVVGLIHHCL